MTGNDIQLRIRQDQYPSVKQSFRRVLEKYSTSETPGRTSTPLATFAFNIDLCSVDFTEAWTFYTPQGQGQGEGQGGGQGGGWLSASSMPWLGGLPPPPRPPPAPALSQATTRIAGASGASASQEVPPTVPASAGEVAAALRLHSARGSNTAGSQHLLGGPLGTNQNPCGNGATYACAHNIDIGMW